MSKKNKQYTLSDYREVYKEVFNVKGKWTKEQEQDFIEILKDFIISRKLKIKSKYFLS